MASTDFEIDLPNGDIEFQLYVSGLPRDVAEDFAKETVQPGQTRWAR